ncbi:hypothetical protein B0H11DRAFT_1994204 [Mycena galericulata]|nr:hypothetical protein B0H11DRAFT_1994204 [Mycena galericulata]
MPSLSTRSSQSWLRTHRLRNILYSILGLGTLAGLFYVGHLHFKGSIPIEKELLSKITTDTPISGFYGPGPWWGWLITLGMSHGHTYMASKNTGTEPDWDYDLIGASFYIVAAETDLILKAKEISQLGNKASDSVLLPALLCAERAAAVGNGFCLFTIITTLVFNYSSRFRAAGITAIPLILGIVASFFTLHAHEAIFQTVPVIWCDLHRGIKEQIFFFTLVDFPADYLMIVLSLIQNFASQTYWIVAGIVASLVSAIVWVVQPRNMTRPLVQILLAGAILVAIPCLLALQMVGIGIVLISLFCVFWLPIYIRAFFPYLGYFPPTGTTRSVLDMDQFSALLAVVVVALIRSWRPIYDRYFKAMIKSHLSSSALDTESVPLLPLSSSGAGGSGEVEAH